MKQYLKIFFLIVVVISCSFSKLEAQQLTNLPVESITLELYLPQIADTTIKAIVKDKIAWLNVEDVFNFLKINYKTFDSSKTIKGFFIQTDSLYNISQLSMRYSYRNISTDLSDNDLIYYEGHLYLNTLLFDSIFGFNCQYDFRGFNVSIYTKKELPIIIEHRQALIRNNLSKVRNLVITDTVIKDQYKLFNISVADWSLNNVININKRKETQANFALGGSLLGGEVNMSLQYNNVSGFDQRQQYFLWKRVTNDHLLLKQWAVGKINTNSIASIFAPVLGFSISNTPTNTRTNFGMYRVNKYTEPNWIVELYVNGILVSFTKADASGLYSFDIPIVYGTSQIIVKFYGPNGEQKNTQLDINIPYNFLPKHKVEYVVSSGIVQDTLSSRYSKAQVNYGISNSMTIGSGIEYLSSIITRNNLPYLSINYKVSNNFLLVAQYTQDVKTSFSGNYRLPKNMLLEANFIKYTAGQKAIFNNYLEERSLAFSFPWILRKQRYYSRIHLYQIMLPATNYTNIEALLSGIFLGTNINFTNYAIYSKGYNAHFYSNLSLNYYFKSGISLMPMLQYDYSNSKFISGRLQLEKNISNKTYFNVFFENNFKSNLQSVNIGMRYDFNFMQSGYAFRTNGDLGSSIISYFRGSMLREKSSGYFDYDNRSNIGRSGIVLYAFLDFNNNGIKDFFEPKVNGLKYSFPGGVRLVNKKDSSILIKNLEPYYKYIVNIDKNSFDEIAWKINLSSISVELNPNQFLSVAIPVKVLGEVSGFVSVYDNSLKNPLGRIIVEIYNEKNILVASCLSEDDGYYSYLGLFPGNYYVKPNVSQLDKLLLQFKQSIIPFSIESLYHGDNKTGINLDLKK